MSKRQPRDREHLRRTAARFDPPPTIDPYYIQTPQEPGEAPGWYWQPHDANAPVYLGANVYMAETALQMKRRGAAA